jgi:cyclopropane fatty-acyl-phospholipid synthase-like methyltransferase
MLAAEHPAWVEFARTMTPAGALLGRLLARLLGASAGSCRKVLDIAAGHGLYGIALAREHPEAEIFALDWPNVLAVAREHAEAAGVAARFHTIAGSVFTAELGDGYDLALLTNFLPDLDPAACERLLARVHAALAPGGRAVALQFVANEDRASPPAAAALSLLMLATTPGGDTYTFSELDGMFRRAGFTRTELRELPPSPERVVIGYRSR